MLVLFEMRFDFVGWRQLAELAGCYFYLMLAYCSDWWKEKCLVDCSFDFVDCSIEQGFAESLWVWSGCDRIVH